MSLVGVPGSGAAAGPIVAEQTVFRDSNTLFATFDLETDNTGRLDVLVPPGNYRVQVNNGRSTVTGGEYSVKEGADAVPGFVSAYLEVASAVRPDRVSTLTINYSNDGSSDAPAPLFSLPRTMPNSNCPVRPPSRRAP